MAWNGTGTYSRIHNWVADAAVPIDITASRMDAEDDSIAAGINNCIAKDGQNAATANLPMGGFKHTGVAASAARTDYARVAELVDGTHTWEGTETGAADAYEITPSPAITAYAAGQQFSFVPANDNTGASTLAVSGLAAKDIKLVNGSDPGPGDIDATGICKVQYDGTNFVLLNPATSGRLYRETALSMSGGGSVNFADIPSWARRITIGVFDADCVSGLCQLALQIGPSGGVETSGYRGMTTYRDTGVGVSGTIHSTYWDMGGGASSFLADTVDSTAVLINVNGDQWNFAVNAYAQDATPSTYAGYFGHGTKTLAGTLSQLTISSTSANFASGTANIIIEG